VIARNLGSTYMLLPAPLMRLRVLLAARLPPGSPALQVCVCVFVCVCVCVRAHCINHRINVSYEAA
jgi:hypothetical protein